MALKFLFGGSGSGKSTLIYQDFLKQAKQSPHKEFFVMVPDQFTMMTQKQLCEMSPSGGIMNIDVQSFSRLIHRICDELGTSHGDVLDDTGKNLILRRVAELHEEELGFLKTKLKRPGYIHEVKSMLSEFYQYDIGISDLNDMIASSQSKGMLSAKLADLRVLFIGFKEYLQDKFITSEEMLDELCKMIPKSELLKGSQIVFDGFTGFTPIQIRVILQLLEVAEDVTITLNADGPSDLEVAGPQRLFALSSDTYQRLSVGAAKRKITVQKPVFISDKPVKRYEGKDDLAFLESQLFRYQKDTFDSVPANIQIYEAQSLVSEIQQVCLQMKRLVRQKGYHYRDLAVITGDLTRYEHIIKTEFARYGIPYYMDQNRSVSASPMVEYLISAMRIRKERFSYESVFRFLRSGMSNLTMDEIDMLEMYVVSHGIKGKKAYESAFERGDEAEQMDALRKRLLEELSPLFVPCKSAKDYVLALYEFAVQNQLQKKCEAFAKQFEEDGDLARAKEYEKIYPACMDLLNQIYELIGEDLLKQEEFIQIFEAGISEVRIGTIPQNVDQALVGDMERSRLNGVKALFFVGVNDGVIPGKGSSGGLLSDMEREFLKEGGIELAPTPRQKIFEQRLYLYQNMTKPSDQLYLSYAKIGGNGTAILPAYLIRTLTGLFPKLTIEVETEEVNVLDQIESMEDGLDDLAQMLRMYASSEVEPQSEQEETLYRTIQILAQAYSGEEQFDQIKKAAFYRGQQIPLKKEVADALYEGHASASISRVELFAKCAFAHFLRYGLKLKERKEYEFAQVDFGTIYHAVMEQVFSNLKEQKMSLRDCGDEQIQEMIEETLAQVTAEYGDQILHSSARNQHRIWQMEQVLLQSAKTMRHHLKKGTFEPAYLERAFTIAGPVSVVGKIDRIDLCTQGNKTYVKVIDYKTGEQKFDFSELYYGLRLQLPLYLQAAMSYLKKRYPEQEMIPASMLYYHLSQPMMKDADMNFPTNSSLYEQDLEAKTYKAMRMDGLTLSGEEIIAMIDADAQYESDVIKLSRKKNGEFKSGAQVCESEQLTTYMDYAEYKTKQLMKKALDGEIAINPVAMEGAQTSSCTYCAYSSVCRKDSHLQTGEIKELKKLAKDNVKEVMRDEINRGSAEGSGY